MRAALVVILCCAMAHVACAQDQELQDQELQGQELRGQELRGQEPQPLQPMPPGQPAQTLDRTPATLHGLVRNAATGEGVPRALVRIEGDVDTGALTDGDGRFAITGIPVGPQAVDVSKPGFTNPSFPGNAEAPAGVSGPPHNVLVAADMPDVVFTLAPTGAIRGRVDLSTEDAAEGIEVGLVRRTVSDGRSIWQASGFTKTRSDGAYRFGGLADGRYAVYTTPTLDSEPAATLVAPGKNAAAERWGYASVYYPDARDPSGATAISVSNGAEAQANFTLTREPFHTVTASVMGPPNFAAAPASGNFSTELTDGAGHQLAYPTQYDQNAHTIQAALPDGPYSIVIAVTPQPMTGRLMSGAEPANDGVLAGEVDFAVAGHAIANLRVPLAPAAASPVQVSVIHGGTSPAATHDEQIAVMLSPADLWGGGAISSPYASGTTDGPLAGNYMSPGKYWAHTFVSGQGFCESSLTAGGAGLGREPLTIGSSGTSAPLELTLRDDCAKLALSLPENLMEMGAGEEKYYTVYVVPDFDFTWDISPILLRPTSGGTFTLNNLTPGNYHVYTFEGTANLEYRNPAALAALPNPGQAVTLSPGTTANLVLEAPGQ
jgi:hypothetical protein